MTNSTEFQKRQAAMEMAIGASAANASPEEVVRKAEHFLAFLENRDVATAVFTASERKQLSTLQAFRSAVMGWREHDHPEWFCRRTAECLAGLGEEAEKR